LFLDDQDECGLLFWYKEVQRDEKEEREQEQKIKGNAGT
jgi:hypothetical protein